MKRIIIITLFMVMCVASVYVLPRFIYGTFGLLTNAKSDEIVVDTKDLPYDDAKVLNPFFVNDKEKRYQHYTKYRDTWSTTTPFWLTRKREEIESGLYKKDFK